MNLLAFLFRLREPGCYSSECNAVHLNVELAPLLGESFRKPDHARLASGVVRLAGVSARARRRADIHDLARARLSVFLFLALSRLAQERRGRANDSKRRGQVHAQ